MPRSWLKQRKRDHYYRLAKKERYRSRAAYKLFQINERFNVIGKGDTVLDLGCAPGGWSQAALELVGRTGKVVGVDLKSMAPIEGLVFVRGDASAPATVESIKKETPLVDVLVSDMSPRISGDRSYDQARFSELGELALGLARELLRPGGNMVMKIFQGERSNEVLVMVERMFRDVRIFRPMASNARSAEVYIVGMGFRPLRDVTHHSKSINI